MPRLPVKNAEFPGVAESAEINERLHAEIRKNADRDCRDCTYCRECKFCQDWRGCPECRVTMPKLPQLTLLPTENGRLHDEIEKLPRLPGVQNLQILARLPTLAKVLRLPRVSPKIAEFVDIANVVCRDCQPRIRHYHLCRHNR